ncbi:tudor domain-containing protein 7B isoform X2 [Palaemon carinicauda]|uniref:tudor domain-containing protein 7B isoform X2 n=1 Tax=Palaemon carinicauda TaxID=392227 RepID=UPI0035B6033C
MATNNASIEKLQEEVLNSLQSLISSCGGECQADTLQKDYRDLLGSAVPIKKFSHGTFASFLLAYPKVFVCTNRGGQLYVRLKDDKNASHIAKFAREQKKATRKIKGKPKPGRRPVFSSWMPAHDIRQISADIHQNWREPFKPIQTTTNGPRSRNPRATIERKPSFPAPQRQFGKPFRSQAPPRRPDYPQAVTRNAPLTKPRFSQPDKPKSPPPGKPKSPPPTVTKLPTTGPVKSKLPPTVNVRSPLLPTPPIPKNNPSALYYNDGNFSFPRAIRDNQDKQYAPYFEVPPRFKKTETKPVVRTFKQTLEEEIKRKGIKQDLVFRSIPCGKKTQHWVSVVNVNGTSVSSYPGEFVNVQDAEEEVARKALEILKQHEETQYPVTGDLKTSIDRVEKILISEAGGVVWLDLVQNLYKENYHEVLPDNWAKEVEKFNKDNNIKYGVVVDNPVLDRWTVQLKQQETTNTTPYFAPSQESEAMSAMYENFRQQYIENPGETYTQETGQEFNGIHYQLKDNMNLVNGISEMNILETEQNEESQLLPSLELPMTNYWDIYVTYIEDLSRVNFRLIGENYSGAYEDMITEMELYYMEDKNKSQVTEPKKGHIYAASHDDSWCRVKVLKVSGNEATVCFFDHGDEEDLNTSQLYELHEKFMELPAQAVCCSLAGLEFGGKDQSSLTLLQNLALGQTLVAQVMSRGNTISLVLYNTTTEDDVNINEKVSEQMDLSFVEPTLPAVGGVAEVYLIHTTSTGDVYVQVETETYKVLQSLLEIARSRTAEILGEDAKIDLTRLYLARYSEDGEWYRAAPRANVDPNGKALLCRLHNVPPSEGLQWTSRACQRIIELIPEDSPLLLKVHATGCNGGPTEVELFKRLPATNELVSINATLSMDESLFSASGDSNNNSLRKEIVLSPTRMKSRCGSSTSITSGSSGMNSGPSSMSSQHEQNSRASSPLEMSKRFLQPGSLLPMDLPAIGEFFDVYITYAASPSNFAVQPWKMSRKVTDLMNEMQRYYALETNLKSDTVIKVGGYFAVKHIDNNWYRAYLTMANEGIVSGLFVDFGDCFVVTQDCVQPLPPVFRCLPCQAIKAKLAGVAAANLDWRPEDSYRFKELVEYCELVSIITNIEQDKETLEYILSLRLVDTSDPKLDVYIDEILIAEKRAIKSE